MKCNYVLIPQWVKVRKYKVDESGLKKLLKQHKNYSNKKIASALNVNLTTVEHWFRADSYFCIPEPENWFQLKKLMNIDCEDFDESITTFEEKIGTFEKAERCYLTDGLSPCVMTCEVPSILVRV